MTPAEKKERGAYFTPQPVAQFLSDWAIRTPNDAILEPSCGEAVFLEAAVGVALRLFRTRTAKLT